MVAGITISEVSDLVSGLGSLVLSFLALGFSIYAWRKTSFRHLFKEKQLEAVFKLTDQLQDTIFDVARYDLGKSGSSGSLVRFFHARESRPHHAEFVKTSAFVTSEFMHHAYPFIQLSEDPYMPPVLADRIRAFYADDYQPIDLSTLASYTRLGGFDLGLEGERQHYVINDPIYKNFGTLLDACASLDDAITKWLRSVGIREFNRKVIIE